MNLWQCPHPREFLDLIFETLQKGDRHVVIHMPYWRVDEFREALYSVNRRYRYPLDFPLPLPEASPYDYLDQCVREGQDLAAGNLMNQAMNKENIFLLMPASLNPQRQEEWLDFMDRVGTDSRNYQDRHFDNMEPEDCLIPLPWRLLILVPSHFASPQPETSLEIFLGSGLTSQSDLEYAIENCITEYNVNKTSSRLWLASICQGLGSRDVSLCHYIFKKLPISGDDVLKMLKSYPFPEMDKEMKSWVIALDESSCQRKDMWRQKQRLRDLGILDRDCGDVESLHPSALAQANRPYTIYRLLLQGQIRTYMPLVQEVQTFIHNRLGRLCGDDWHKKDPENYPGLDMEIGPLAHYMSAYLKGECGNELLELAHSWRLLRHQIAHGNLIEFESARNAVDLYEKLRKGEEQFL